MLFSPQQLGGIFFELFSVPCWHSEKKKIINVLAVLPTCCFCFKSTRLPDGTACAASLCLMCRKDNEGGSADVQGTKKAVEDTKL